MTIGWPSGAAPSPGAAGVWGDSSALVPQAQSVRTSVSVRISAISYFMLVSSFVWVLYFRPTATIKSL